MMETHIWTTANLSLEIKLLLESKGSFSDFLLTAERDIKVHNVMDLQGVCREVWNARSLIHRAAKGKCWYNYYFKQVFAICHDDTWRLDRA